MTNKLLLGYGYSYEQILVPWPEGDESILGQTLRVRITEVSKFHMKSVIIDSPPPTSKTVQLQKDHSLSRKSFVKVVIVALVVSQLLIIGYMLLRSTLSVVAD